jgi:hypothetical protein
VNAAERRHELYLDAVEDAHRRRCDRFCYVATGVQGTWRVSIAEAGKHRHYPLSDDHFMGTETEANAEADRLNSERLHIGPREAALIVASSMADPYGIKR